MYSRKSHAPTGTIRNGASDPISAAFATLLCVAPTKNAARLRPKKTPGTSTWRTSRIVTRRPVLQSTAFHSRLTVTIRQNATRTPGDSARLTSVELSENATTRPTTASTPSVFALSPRSRPGILDHSAPASGAALTGPPYPRSHPRPEHRRVPTAPAEPSAGLADGRISRAAQSRRPGRPA